MARRPPQVPHAPGQHPEPLPNPPDPPQGAAPIAPPNVLDIGMAWTRRLERAGRDADAPLLSNDRNALIALRYAPEWQGVIAYDQFAARPVALRQPPDGNTLHTKFPRPWSDDDAIDAMFWMQAQGMSNVSLRSIHHAVRKVALAHACHPIRDWLAALEWDGVPRIEGWLTTYMSADENAYTKAAGARFLISMVARVMEPGCQVDTVLTLVGKQGTYKSQALRALASPDWYSPYISSLSTKDAMSDLHGVWLLELAEFEALNHVSVDTAKRFITGQVDKFRPPYGTHKIERRRETVLVATTNEDTFLKDVTGDRRYWPVAVGYIALDKLKVDRERLFAEAFAHYLADKPWHLDTPELQEMAKIEQTERLDVDLWHDLVRTFCFGKEEVTIPEVLTHGIKRADAGTWTKAEKDRVGRCLRTLGYTRRQRRYGLRDYFFVKTGGSQ